MEYDDTYFGFASGLMATFCADAELVNFTRDGDSVTITIDSETRSYSQRDLAAKIKEMTS